jgi:hypothetical protein
MLDTIGVSLIAETVGEPFTNVIVAIHFNDQN